MKSKFLLILLWALFACSEKEEEIMPKPDSSLQTSRVMEVPVSFASLGANRFVSIYLPKGYDKSNTQTKYNVLIYLHGAAGNSSVFMANIIKQAADSLINSNQVKPFIGLMPDMLHPTEPSYGHRHMYANSEYYGKYSDAISKDLVEFISNATEENLGQKVLTARENLAIAGFSMGGDGALRIGFKNPEKFVAIAAHGTAPSLSASSISSFVIPTILAENAATKDANGNYSFSNNSTSSLTFALWGVSAGYGPLVNGQINYVINKNGSLNEKAHAEWLKTGDCLSLIKAKSLYTNASAFNPSFYLEVGGSDNLFLDISNTFINTELKSAGVDPKYFQYVITQGKGHGLDRDRVIGALKFLNQYLK
jgi:poly(3-hydroxybutyrate) depolymerase